MKKSLLVLSCLAIAFTSCTIETECECVFSIPEEEIFNLQEYLIGEWEVTSANAGDNIQLFEIDFIFEAESLDITGISNLESNNLNHSNVFSGSQEIEIDTLRNEIIIGDNVLTTSRIREREFELSYQSRFPKPTDNEREITLTLEKLTN